jgi:uncharacterized protein YjbJ (UPF0337 family)
VAGPEVLASRRPETGRLAGRRLPQAAAHPRRHWAHRRTPDASRNSGRSIHLLKENRMNWNQVQGNWKQFKGKVKQQWGKLSDDYLDEIDGKREQLIGKIQEQYGISQQEAERQVKDWENRQ